MKNPNNSIGNRTLDLPAFSSMHQPTAPVSYLSINELRVNLGVQILKELLLKTILFAFCFIPK